jgi:hypothetical protein
MRSPIRSTNDIGHDEFFRTRLLTSDAEQIAALVDSMEKEAESIRQESLKMSWYMRGGITYDQVLALSSKERSMISNIIKDNLDTTKKSKLPFF